MVYSLFLSLSHIASCQSWYYCNTEKIKHPRVTALLSAIQEIYLECVQTCLHNFDGYPQIEYTVTGSFDVPMVQTIIIPALVNHIVRAKFIYWNQLSSVFCNFLVNGHIH